MTVEESGISNRNSKHRGTLQAYASFREMDAQDSVQLSLPQVINALKAARAEGTKDLDEARELALMFEDKKVRNLFAWLVYDRYIKEKTDSDLCANTDIIVDCFRICQQTERESNNHIPCPVTMGLLRLAGAVAKKPNSARKVVDILSGLEIDKLSGRPEVMEDNTGKELRMASDLEKALSLQTKALLSIGQFREVRRLCEYAFQHLPSMHYDNDLWFRMRMAIAEEGLGNLVGSEGLFREIIAGRKGRDKWFLYSRLAGILYKQEKFDEAWKYCLEAVRLGQKPEYMIAHYLLQARILYKMGRTDEGKVLAELIGSILNRNGWHSGAGYERLFKHYGINRDDLPVPAKILPGAKRFWEKERSSYRGPEASELNCAVKGQVLKGRINNIVEYGMFLSLPGYPDGLLHINNLPESLRDNFRKNFSRGNTMQVEVLRQTAKGLVLKFYEKAE